MGNSIGDYLYKRERAFQQKRITPLPNDTLNRSSASIINSSGTEQIDNEVVDVEEKQL